MTVPLFSNPEKAFYEGTCIVRVTVALLIGVLGGCGSRPPTPPPLGDSQYVPIVRERLREIPHDRFAVSIAGLRLARGGIYVDLLVAGEGAGLVEGAELWGYALSTADDPKRFLELQTEEGEPINLKPMSFPPSLPMTDWWGPPTHRLGTVDGIPAVIQPVMLRTGRRLEPGRYFVRLIERDVSAWIDPAWREVIAVR